VRAELVRRRLSEVSRLDREIADVDPSGCLLHMPAGRALTTNEPAVAHTSALELSGAVGLPPLIELGLDHHASGANFTHDDAFMRKSLNY
jgi:hypothetical protein